MKYFVGAELGVANFLQRHFDWNANALWYEEIPNARDATKTMFFVGGKDAIVDASVSPVLRRCANCNHADGHASCALCSASSGTSRRTASATGCGSTRTGGTARRCSRAARATVRCSAGCASLGTCVLLSYPPSKPGRNLYTRPQPNPAAFAAPGLMNLLLLLKGVVE